MPTLKGHERRVIRLEERIAARKCPRCFNYPVRELHIDCDTDDIVFESMPEAGCPDCGTPIKGEYHIVIPNDSGDGF